MYAVLAYPEDIDPAEVRRVVLRAIVNSPQDGFSVARLASSYGLPAISVHAALTSLLAAGLVVADGDEFVSAIQLD